MADETRVIEIVVEADQAQQSIEKLNKSLDENQQETKETTKETKDYDKQLKDTSQTTTAMTGYLDKMTGGLFSSAKAIGTSVKALRTFKIALAATGIGAIIVAIGSLIAMFQRSEEGQNKWNKILRVTGSVIDNLFDKFSALGEIIYDAIVNPVEAAKKAWQSIKDFFNDPIGSIKEGYEAAKEAAKDFVDEVKNEIEIAEDLADLEAKTNELERQFWIDRAKAELQISTLRRKARQEDDYSAQQRAEFQKEAIKLLDELAAKEEVIAANRLNIIRESNELANSTKEAKDAEARAEEELIQIQVRRQDTARGLERVLNQLNNQADKERQNRVKLKEATDTLIDSDEDWNFVLKQTDEIIKKSNDAYTEFTKLANERGDELADIQEEVLDFTEDSTDAQNKLNDAISISTQAATGLLDVLQGKVKGKDIFKSVLKTITGILSIVLPGSGAAIGGIGSFIGGLFADGGMLEGPPHSRGGVWVNAEGGEGIINKRSMSIPWVRQLASDLNQIGGGVKFADGGMVPTPTSTDLQLNQIADALRNERIVLSIPDLITETQKVTTIQERADL